MSATTKVLLEVQGGNVSVQALEERDGVLMLNAHGVFFNLGTVREVTLPGKKPNTVVKAWQWSCDGFRGESTTKGGAVRAMLADCGYEQVSLTATIPDLLEGLPL